MKGKYCHYVWLTPIFASPFCSAIYHNNHKWICHRWLMPCAPIMGKMLLIFYLFLSYKNDASNTLNLLIMSGHFSYYFTINSPSSQPLRSFVSIILMKLKQQPIILFIKWVWKNLFIIYLNLINFLYNYFKSILKKL